MKFEIDKYKIIYIEYTLDNMYKFMYNSCMNDDNYVFELKNKLSLLQGEISELQKSVQSSLEKIDEKQKVIEHIVRLLEIEGVGLENSEITDFLNKSYSDLAYEFLSSFDPKEPLHYRELYKNFVAKGIPISGKDPAANLLTHISRDDRFVRVSPGTYGLKEWGLEPIKKKTTRRKRKR